ncbi:hypothetical protein [Xanthomonas oryzae]|uniref:hypothetical protein n=1 Tax=Xanthomonas oryzae TaxID=347 RepID=UPI003DA0F880
MPDMPFNHRSMPLDGGYPGSLDQAIANLAVGRTNGYLEGLDEGLAEGHRRGYEAGRLKGWTDAVNEANPRIEELMAQKAQLAERVREQQELIQQLERKVAALADENRRLAAANGRTTSTDASMQQLVASLKAANAQLAEQVKELDTQLQDQTRELHNVMAQYGKSIVFINAMRTTLEHLTSERSPQAQYVRELFAESYGEQVSEALRDGYIKAPLENDSAFAKQLPRTHQFLNDLLSKVAAPPADSEQDESPSP